MTSYTITIAPNDDSGAATRLIVDTSGDETLITDVHLHAPRGLSSRHIPAVDVDLLLRAVTGGTAGGAAPARTVPDATALPAPQDETPALEAAPPADEPAPAPSRRTRKATPARKRTAAPSEEAPRRARATGTPGARKAKQPAAKATRKATAAQTPRKATAAQTPRKTAAAQTPRKAAGAQKPAKTARAAAPAKSQAPTRRRRAAAEAAPAGRVYRRMPEDLAAVLRQVGTVAGVAAHYDVPRYTAQGWVSRLRA